MRAWLPERQVYGPEPAGERDTDALNRVFARSEEHTSELQSQSNLVCRLLLEKKNESNETLKLLASTKLPHTVCSPLNEDYYHHNALSVTLAQHLAVRGRTSVGLLFSRKLAT